MPTQMQSEGIKKKTYFLCPWLCRTMSVRAMESHVIENKNSFTNDSFDSGRPNRSIHSRTDPLMHCWSLIEDCIHCKSLFACPEGVCTRPELGVTAGCNEVVEAVEAHSACSAPVCPSILAKIPCSGTVLPLSSWPTDWCLSRMS